MKSDAAALAGHVVHERVRWSDVDKAGIIYFGAYARLVEIAETELYRTLGFPWGGFFERFGVWLPRVHIAFDFKHPAVLDDELAIRTRVLHVGRSSVRYRMEIERAVDGVELAVCTVVIVCVDAATGASSALPEELAHALRGYQQATECAPAT